METQDYCRDLKSALSDWKTKIHTVVGEFETISGGEKEKADPLVSELRAITEQHTARMEELSKRCPTEPTAAGSNERRSVRFKKRWQELAEYRRYRIRI